MRKDRSKLEKLPEESCNNYNVFAERWFWICVSAIQCLKCLLIPAYHSTDFEVHRNWMAITNKLPLRLWYYENTSEWTLDYPPLFAYFEYILSQFAALMVPSALTIQKEPLLSDDLLIFHRFTVIITDSFYIASVGFLANSFLVVNCATNSLIRCSVSISILLIANVSFIMVDNIHFQYNGLLTSFLLFSVGCILRRKFLMAAFLYCVLLNMKHIYLYYAFGYAIFYLTAYVSSDAYSIFGQFIKLTSVMVIPFILSFGPLIYCAGWTVLSQIISRLFPFQRGLTHAYWAPNLWALYNLADFLLYHILKVVQKLPDGTHPPQYTSGLVQEYDHSILPSVTAFHSLLTTVLLLCPMLITVRLHFTRDIPLLLTHSAFAFFLAGYHVHEKAIMLITVPYTILAFSDHRFLLSFVVLSAVANISLFPLFFTSFENLIKIAISLFYYCLSECIAKFACSGDATKGIWKRSFLLCLALIQTYCEFGHSALFGSRYEFVPLMLTSVSTAVGILFLFIEFLWLSYFSHTITSCKHKVKTS